MASAGGTRTARRTAGNAPSAAAPGGSAGGPRATRRRRGAQGPGRRPAARAPHRRERAERRGAERERGGAEDDLHRQPVGGGGKAEVLVVEAEHRVAQPPPDGHAQGDADERDRARPLQGG